MKTLPSILIAASTILCTTALSQQNENQKIRVLDTRPAKETGGFKLPNSTITYFNKPFLPSQVWQTNDILILDLSKPIKQIDGTGQLRWTPFKKIIVTNCPYFLTDVLKHFWEPDALAAEGKLDPNPNTQVERLQLKNGSQLGATVIRINDPASAKASESQKRAINDKLIQQVLTGA